MRPFKYGCVVDGENFCPRPELERQLCAFAESGQNAVVYGSRRMGKTSLIQHAIKSMRGEKLIYIDLYCIKTCADFCARVMKGIAGASDQMSFLKRVLQFATRLRPALTIDPLDGSPSITIDAHAAGQTDSLDTVMATLKKLGEDGRTCIVFDEFQDLLKLENGDAILAEMRSTIQFQQNTPYFFSGSVRSDMMRIFDDPDSPFFKSALPFSVDEIDPVQFAKFIIARFKKGDRAISQATAAAVIAFADGVTGDVQEFCEALYESTETGQEITVDDFPAAFATVFGRELRGYEATVERLTPQQFAVAKALAEDGRVRPFSAEFTKKVGMLPSSVKRVLTRLVDDRIIFLRKGEYCYFNPFFREWIKRAF